MKKYVVVASLVLALIIGSIASAQSTPKTQLAFLVDGSGSIGTTNFNIMKNGIADALEDSSCVPHDGSLELTVVQFSDDATTELNATIITASNVSTIANQIRAMPYQEGLTNYEAGFDEAIASVTGSPNFGSFDNKVINITTDGAPNRGELNMSNLRNNAVNAGFDEIDAEGIGFATAQQNTLAAEGADVTVSSVAVLSELVHPQPASVHPPSPWPPTAKGWVRLVDDVNEFADTVCEKFQVTTAPPPTPTPPPPEIPEPVTIILFSSGAAAVGVYVNRRRRAIGDSPADDA